MFLYKLLLKQQYVHSTPPPVQNNLNDKRSRKLNNLRWSCRREAIGQHASRNELTQALSQSWSIMGLRYIQSLADRFMFANAKNYHGVHVRNLLGIHW